MGVHICNGALVLLVLLQAAMLPPAAGRILRQRFGAAPKKAGMPAADTMKGSEIIVVLKPAETADGKSSKDAVEDLKFAVANEGMRPIPLKNFLSQHGMNPKARLPPLHTLTPGTGAVVPMGAVPLDMETVEADTEKAATPPAPAPPGQFFPAGFETTPPPDAVKKIGNEPGALRNALTTPVPPEEVIDPNPAPAAAPGPAVATTTMMMLIHEDAYAVRSVRPPVNLVRSADGHILECSQCKCTKHVNGGVEEVDDPSCE